MNRILLHQSSESGSHRSRTDESPFAWKSPPPQIPNGCPDAPAIPEMHFQYNQNRHYDPTPGRWLSEDQAGCEAGDENLQKYVGG